MKPKASYLRSNRIDEILARLIRKKKERRHVMTSIRNEESGITTITKDIKRIIREY